MLIFDPANIKQNAYELDNLNEHGAELPSRPGTLDEPEAMVSRQTL